jgi:O-antigen ligase
MKMAQAMEWSGSSRAAFATPSTSRMSLHWLVRTCLCFSFLLAFFQFELAGATAQFLPLIAFAGCGLLILCGRHRAERLQHVFSGGALLFLAVVFTEVVSYTSHDNYSAAYGLAFIVVILCARLIVQEIGVPEVLRAYSQAAFLTVTFICLTGGRVLLSGSSTRFSGGTRAHPNLIAFILGGFLPVVIWRAIEEKIRWRKWVMVGLAFATFAFTFFTGSRGTLFAVLIAALSLFVRGVAGGSWMQRLRIRHFHIIVFLFLIPLGIAFLLQHNRIGHFADYLNDFLSLNSSQRGVKSGLSGRTGFWHRAFLILRSRDRWLFGFGYRAGDRLVGTIDNGYVQLLFESGLIAGSMILGSMLRVFFLLWKASRMRENNAWTRYYTMIWCMMIIYFLNNISTRYLFSFGSNFSLCIILLMAASRRELVGDTLRGHALQKVRAGKPAPVRSLAWDRSVR